MHGSIDVIELSHDFCSVIECHHCHSSAHLRVVARAMCPRREIMIETRIFGCRGCLNQTYLTVPV